MRAAATAVGLSVLFTALAAPYAEAGFWEDRRTARRPAASDAPAARATATASLALPPLSGDPLFGSFRLSDRLGSVTESRPAPAAGAPTVFHLQDAHGLYGAQRNASEIIAGLSAARGAPLLVLQEGGVGPVDPSVLADFPFEDVRQQVADAHLRAGDLTGEEHRALAQPGAVRLVGVETRSLFEANLKARHGTAADRAAALKAFDVLESRLGAVKKAVYPPDLTALDAVARDYRARRADLAQYLAAFARAVPPAELSRAFPAVSAFLSLKAQEESLDFKAVEAARAELVKGLLQDASASEVQALVARAADVRAGLAPAPRFYADLLDLASARGVKAAKAAEPLRRYIAYAQSAARLDHAALLRESDALLDRAFAPYAGREPVATLAAASRRLGRERALWDQLMPPAEFEAYRREGALDGPATEAFLAREEARLRLPKGAAADWRFTARRGEVEDFFKLALRRDAALLDNALKAMKDAGASAAVLVAGGFHTPGLTAGLGDAGLGYAVILPRFEPASAPRRPLLVSLSDRVLQAFGSLREANKLGMPAFGRSLALEMMGAAVVQHVFSAPAAEREDNIRALADYARELAARGVDLKVGAALELKPGEVVLTGRMNGKPYLLLFEDGEGPADDRLRILVGEEEIKTLSTAKARNISDRLGALREGLKAGETVAELAGRVRATVVSLRPDLKVDVDAMALVAETQAALAWARAPRTEPAREGAAALKALPGAVSASVDNIKAAPSSFDRWWPFAAAAVVGAGVGLAAVPAVAKASAGALGAAVSAAAPAAPWIALTAALAFAGVLLFRGLRTAGRAPPAGVAAVEPPPAGVEAAPEFEPPFDVEPSDPAPAPRPSALRAWAPLAFAAAAFAFYFFWGVPALKTFVDGLAGLNAAAGGSLSLQGLARSALGLVSWALYFTGNVVVVLSLVVVVARLVLNTAPGQRATIALRNAPVLKWLAGGGAAYGRWVKAWGEDKSVFRRATAGFAHIPISLAHTMYAFGFERIDRLFKLWMVKTGRLTVEDADVKDPLLHERAFNRLPASLQILLLPFFATWGILYKRVALMVYSAVGQAGLVGALALALGGVGMLMGVTTDVTVGWVSAALNFNLLDPVLGAAETQSLITGGGFWGAAVQAASPFALASSYTLAMLLGSFGGARRVRETAAAQGRPVPWWPVAWLKTFSVWDSYVRAAKSAFNPVEGIHFVGLEIELLKAASAPFDSLHDLVMKVEGDEGVLGAGQQAVKSVLDPLGIDPGRWISRVPGMHELTVDEVRALRGRPYIETPLRPEPAKAAEPRPGAPVPPPAPEPKPSAPAAPEEPVVSPAAPETDLAQSTPEPAPKLLKRDALPHRNKEAHDKLIEQIYDTAKPAVQGAAEAIVDAAQGPASVRSSERHLGKDIPMPEGTPIYAVESGEAIITREKSGALSMRLTAGDRRFDYLYISADEGFLSAQERRALDAGTPVRRAVRSGQRIGRVGPPLEPGVGEPHLHFGVWKDGRPEDPALYQAGTGRSPFTSFAGREEAPPPAVPVDFTKPVDLEAMMKDGVVSFTEALNAVPRQTDVRIQEEEIKKGRDFFEFLKRRFTLDLVISYQFRSVRDGEGLQAPRPMASTAPLLRVDDRALPPAGERAKEREAILGMPAFREMSASSTPRLAADEFTDARLRAVAEGDADPARRREARQALGVADAFASRARFARVENNLTGKAFDVVTLDLPERKGSGLPESVHADGYFRSLHHASSSRDFRELFGIESLRIDRDGDGQPEARAPGAYDLLATNDSRLEPARNIAHFLALNGRELEAKTNRGVSTILKDMNSAKAGYRVYAAESGAGVAGKDQALTEGDFGRLLAIDQESKGNIGVFLADPRLRAELIARFDLYNADQQTEKEAFLWYQKQLELIHERTRAEQALSLADLYRDIQTVRHNMDRLEALKAELLDKAAEGDRKIAGEVEDARIRPIVNQEILRVESMLFALREQLDAARHNIARILRIPADRLARVRFGLERTPIEDMLRAAGVGDHATLTRQIAHARMMQYKEAVPDLFQKNVNAGAALNLLPIFVRLGGAPFLGLDVMTSGGVFDRERQVRREAAMWAYARTVVEAKEVDVALGIELAKKKRELAQKEVLLAEKAALVARQEEALARQRATLADNRSALFEYLRLLRRADEDRANLEQVRRERDRIVKELVKYEGRYRAPDAPVPTKLDKALTVSGDVLATVLNPLTAIAEWAQKGQEAARVRAIEDFLRGRERPAVQWKNPTLGGLYEAARERNVLFQKAQALIRQREKDVKAIDAGILSPRLATGMRYFATPVYSRRDGQVVFDPAALAKGRLSFGINLRMTLHDPARDVKVMAAERELEISELEAADLSGKVYFSLGWQLDIMGRLNTMAKAQEEQLAALDRQIEESRAFENFGVDRNVDLAALDSLRSQRVERLRETNLQRDLLVMELKRTAGLSDRDIVEFTRDYDAGKVRRMLEVRRFDRFVKEEAAGEASLTDEGRGALKLAAEKAVPEARLSRIALEAALWARLAETSGAPQALVETLRAKARDAAGFLPPADGPPAPDMARRLANAEFLLDDVRARAAAVPALKLAAERNGNHRLLAEMDRQLQVLQDLVSRTDGDPLERLRHVSEVSVALTALQASLTPSWKWERPEGQRLGALAVDLDKVFMGRFDPFLPQRIALRRAEAHQLKAAAAAGFEALELNVNFIELFAHSFDGGQNRGPALGSFFSAATGFSLVRIPPRLMEEILNPLDWYGKSGIDQVPGLSHILEALLPPLGSSQARKAMVKAELLSAREQLSRAENERRLLGNTREASTAHLWAARDYRDLLRARMEALAAPSQDPLTLEEREKAAQAAGVRLEYGRMLQDAESELMQAEMNLLSLGVSPDAAPRPAAGGRPRSISPAAGRSLSGESFEVRMAELALAREEAREDLAKKSAWLSRAEFWTGFQAGYFPDFSGNDQRVRAAPFSRAVLFDRNASSTAFSAAAQGDRVRAARADVAAARERAARDIQQNYSRYFENKLKAELFEKVVKDDAAAARRVTSVGVADPIVSENIGVMEDTFRLYAAQARRDMARALGDLRTALQDSSLDPVLGTLPSPEGVLDAFAESRGSLMETPLDIKTQPEAEAAARRTDALDKERGEILLKTVLPNVAVNVLSDREDFWNGQVFPELQAAWRLWGGGVTERLSLAGRERAQNEIRRTQTEYELRDAVARSRSRLTNIVKQLALIDGRLKSLTTGDAFQALLRQYQTAKIPAGELTRYVSDLAALLGERSYYLIQFGIEYENVARRVPGVKPLREVLKPAAGGPAARRSLYTDVAQDLYAQAAPGEAPRQGETATDAVPLPARGTAREVKSPPASWLRAERLQASDDVPPSRTTPVAHWAVSEVDSPAELSMRPKNVPAGDEEAYDGVVARGVEHKDYEGPGEFKSAVRSMLRDAGIPAEDNRLLNVDDWAVFLDELMTTYSRKDERVAVMGKMARIFPKVYKRLGGVTNPDDLPNVLSIYAEPVFNGLFPYYRDMMFVPDIGFPSDRNLIKKVSLAFFYALALQDERGADEAWLERLMDKDMEMLAVGIAARRGSAVEDRRMDEYMAWFTDRAVTWNRLVFSRLKSGARKDYADSARAVVKLLFPDIMDRAMLPDPADVDNPKAPLHGNMLLEGMYRSLTAYAIANGLGPDGLLAYGQTLKRAFLPHIQLLKDVSPEQLVIEAAALPDADMLRYLVRQLNAARLTDEERDKLGRGGFSSPEERVAIEDKYARQNVLWEQVNIEAGKARASLGLSMAMFWSGQYLRDRGLNPGVRMAALELEAQSRGFGVLMDRMNKLREMPEAVALARLQQRLPDGAEINWLTAESQGFLSALAVDWMREEGWTEKELRTHLSNVLFIARSRLKDVKEYARLVGRPLEAGLSTTDIMARKELWGAINGLTRTLERVNLWRERGGPDELSQEALVHTLEDLIQIQGTLARKREELLQESARAAEEARRMSAEALNLPEDRKARRLEQAERRRRDADRFRQEAQDVEMESGQGGYLYQMAHGLVLDQDYKLPGKAPHREELATLLEHITSAKRRYLDAGVTAVAKLVRYLDDPASRPSWMTEDDVKKMIVIIEGGSVDLGPGRGVFTVEKGLKDLRVSLKSAIAIATDYMPLRGYTPAQLLKEAEDELLLQAVQMAYHQTEGGRPEPLQRGDIGPYLDNIREGKSTLDQTQRMLKFDGQLQRRLAEVLSKAVEAQLAEVAPRVDAETRKSWLSKLPSLSETERIGMASRLQRLQDLMRLGADAAAIESFIDDWVRDAAYIQAVSLAETGGRFALPSSLLSMAVDMFRLGEPKLNESQLEDVRRKFQTVFKIDPALRDLNAHQPASVYDDKNLLRSLRLGYYAAFNEILEPNDEVELWWLHKWDRLQSRLRQIDPDIRQDEIQIAQQELLVRFVALRKVFFKLVAQPLYEKDPSVDLHAALSKSWDALEESISESLIEQVAGWGTRRKVMAALRERGRAEDEVLTPLHREVAKIRAARGEANKRALSDPLRRQEIQTWIAAQDNVSGTDFGFLRDQMIESGYTKEEVVMRYFILPARVKDAIERASGRVLDMDDPRTKGLVSSISDDIFDRWASLIMAPELRARADAGLARKASQELSNVLDARGAVVGRVDSLEAGMREAFRKLDLQARNAKEIEKMLAGEDLGIRYHADDYIDGLRRESEANRIAADAVDGALGLEELRGWLSVSQKLKAEARRLGVDVSDRELLFLGDSLLRYGVADLYEAPAPDRAAARKAVEEQFKRLNLTPASNWARYVRLLYPDFATQTPSIEADLAKKMSAPGRWNAVLDRIVDRMVDRRIRPAEFKFLVDRTLREQEMVARVARKDEDRGPYEEHAGLMPPRTDLEALLYLDEVNTDGHIGLREILFPDHDPLNPALKPADRKSAADDIVRWERKVGKSRDEAVRNLERDRLDQRAPLPMPKPGFFSALHNEPVSDHFERSELDLAAIGARLADPRTPLDKLLLERTGFTAEAWRGLPAGERESHVLSAANQLLSEDGLRLKAGAQADDLPGWARRLSGRMAADPEEAANRRNIRALNRALFQGQYPAETRASRRTAFFQGVLSSPTGNISLVAFFGPLLGLLFPVVKMVLSAAGLWQAGRWTLHAMETVKPLGRAIKVTEFFNHLLVKGLFVEPEVLSDPLKKALNSVGIAGAAQRRWRPFRLFRFNLFLLSYLVNFWTSYFVLWNLSVVTPYAVAFSSLAAVVFMVPTAYLMKAFPMLNIQMLAGHTMVGLVTAGWIYGFLRVVFPEQADALVGTLTSFFGSKDPVMGVVLVLHAVLAVTSSKWFHKTIKEPFGEILEDEDWEEVKKKAPEMVALDASKELPPAARKPKELLKLQDGEFALMHMPWLPEITKPANNLRDYLRSELYGGMAKSLRGNNDPKLRIILQVNGGMFDLVNRLAEALHKEGLSQNPWEDAGRILDDASKAEDVLPGAGDLVVRMGIIKELKARRLAAMLPIYRPGGLEDPSDGRAVEIAFRILNDPSRADEIVPGSSAMLDELEKTPELNFKLFIGGETAGDFFRIMRAEIEPYWEEFSYTDENGVFHHGSERFQVWYTPGGRKPKLPASLFRWFRWDEDGHAGAFWGQKEYEYRVNQADPKERLDPDLMKPVRVQWTGADAIRSVFGERIGGLMMRLPAVKKLSESKISAWTGLAHLVKEAQKAPGDLDWVPEFASNPFVYGVMAPGERSIVRWQDAKAGKDIGYVKDMAPDAPNKSKVRQWVSIDNGNFLTPGSGVYMFNAMHRHKDHFLFQGSTASFDSKGSYARTLWSYLGDTAHRNLYFAQRALGRMLGGKRAFGKYASFIEDFDDLFAPRPGLPFGGYFTRAWLFSGIMQVWTRNYVGDRLTVREGATAAETEKDRKKRQGFLDRLFTQAIMNSFNAEDELVSNSPGDVTSIWSWVKNGGRRSKEDGPIHPEARRMLDPLLAQMERSQAPPLRDSAVASVVRPDGKAIIGDDRPASIYFELWRWDKKWLEAYDVVQAWLRHVGRSVAQNPRGALFNDFVDRGLVGEFLWTIVLLQSYYFQTNSGNIEVSYANMAWELTRVFFIVLIHPKLTGPLFRRLEYSWWGSGVPAKIPVVGKLLGAVTFFPIAIVHTLLLDLPIMVLETVLSTAVYVPLVIFRAIRVSRAMIFFLPRFLDRGTGGSWVINFVETVTHAIGRYFWLGRAGFAVSSWIAMVFTAGYLEPGSIAWSVLVAGGLLMGVVAGPLAFASEDYKKDFDKYYDHTGKLQKGQVRKNIEEAEAVIKALRESDRTKAAFAALPWRARTSFDSAKLLALVENPADIQKLMKASWGIQAWRLAWLRLWMPFLMMLVAAAWMHTGTPWQAIPRDWAILSSPILIGMLVFPLVSFFASLFFQVDSERWTRFFQRHDKLARILGVELIESRMERRGKMVTVNMVDFGRRLIPVMAWGLGVAVIWATIGVHLPGVQSLTAPFLEVIAKAPITFASTWLGGDSAVGLLAPVLGIKSPFLFLQSLIVVGMLVIAPLGLVTGIFHLFVVLPNEWKDWRFNRSQRKPKPAPSSAAPSPAPLAPPPSGGPARTGPASASGVPSSAASLRASPDAAAPPRANSEPSSAGRAPAPRGDGFLVAALTPGGHKPVTLSAQGNPLSFQDASLLADLLAEWMRARGHTGDMEIPFQVVDGPGASPTYDDGLVRLPRGFLTSLNGNGGGEALWTAVDAAAGNRGRVASKTLFVKARLASLLVIAGLGLSGIPFPAQAEPQKTVPAASADVRSGEQAEEEKFIAQVLKEEGGFHRAGVAYNPNSGLTFDGWDTDDRGRPVQPRPWSTAITEAQHVTLLAAAVAGDPHAALFLSRDDPAGAMRVAVDLLARKLRSYQAFDARHPEFRGFLPHFIPTDQGLEVDKAKENELSALGNGKWAWAVFLAADVLAQAGYKDLADGYHALHEKLARNVIPVFFDEEAGKVKGEVKVIRQPAAIVYKNNIADYYLTDPHEGEMMVLYISVFGEEKPRADGKAPAAARLWRNKAMRMVKHKRLGVAFVQGDRFSAHERGAFLQLPLLDDSLVRRLYFNGELARTEYSSRNGVPGLFSAAHVPGPARRFVPTLGVSDLAANPVAPVQAVSPAAAAPVILADRGVGLVWLARMRALFGDRPDAAAGMTDAIAVDGSSAAQVVTSLSKYALALSLADGARTAMKSALERAGKMSQLMQLVRDEHMQALSKLKGAQSAAGKRLFLPADVRMPKGGAARPRRNAGQAGLVASGAASLSIGAGVVAGLLAAHPWALLAAAPLAALAARLERRPLLRGLLLSATGGYPLMAGLGFLIMAAAVRRAERAADRGAGVRPAGLILPLHGIRPAEDGSGGTISTGADGRMRGRAEVLSRLPAPVQWSLYIHELSHAERGHGRSAVLDEAFAYGRQALTFARVFLSGRGAETARAHTRAALLKAARDFAPNASLDGAADDAELAGAVEAIARGAALAAAAEAGRPDAVRVRELLRLFRIFVASNEGAPPPSSGRPRRLELPRADEGLSFGPAKAFLPAVAGAAVMLANVGVFAAEAAAMAPVSAPAVAIDGLDRLAEYASSAILPPQSRLGLPGEPLSGGFLRDGMPASPADADRRGHAVVVDARAAEVNAEGELMLGAAVAVGLFDQLKSLRPRAGEPLFLDVFVDLDAAATQDPARLAAALQDLVRRSGAAPGLAKRTAFRIVNVRGADAGAAARAVVGAHSAAGVHVLAVTDEAGKDLWTGLDLPGFKVLVARVLQGLLQVEVDVVFSGASAQLLRKNLPADLLNAVQDKNGNLVFRKVRSMPVSSAIKDELGRVALFNMQA